MLKVGGLTPFSATDYPGKLSAVVFVQGCPWACHYCHNPHLQPRATAAALSWGQVLERLRRRTGLLDAVVFSGGEPTLDPALPEAVRQVRALGFAVGLHTAGIYPRQLQAVLPELDWVGLDIKALPQHYDRVTAVQGSAEAPWRSLQAVLDSGVACEVRTTVVSAVHDPDHLRALADALRQRGVQRWAVQSFRAQGCTDPGMLGAPVVRWEPALCKDLAQGFVAMELRKPADSLAQG